MFKNAWNYVKQFFIQLQERTKKKTKNFFFHVAIFFLLKFHMYASNASVNSLFFRIRRWFSAFLFSSSYSLFSDKLAWKRFKVTWGERCCINRKARSILLQSTCANVQFAVSSHAKRVDSEKSFFIFRQNTDAINQKTVCCCGCCCKFQPFLKSFLSLSVLESFFCALIVASHWFKSSRRCVNKPHSEGKLSTSSSMLMNSITFRLR